MVECTGSIATTSLAIDASIHRCSNVLERVEIQHKMAKPYKMAADRPGNLHAAWSGISTNDRDTNSSRVAGRTTKTPSTYVLHSQACQAGSRQAAKHYKAAH